MDRRTMFMDGVVPRHDNDLALSPARTFAVEKPSNAPPLLQLARCRDPTTLVSLGPERYSTRLVGAQAASPGHGCVPTRA